MKRGRNVAIVRLLSVEADLRRAWWSLDGLARVHGVDSRTIRRDIGVLEETRKALRSRVDDDGTRRWNIQANLPNRGARSTHTYAILDVDRATFDDVKRRLAEAGYEHAFHDDVIDMHGIALRVEVEAEPDGSAEEGA